MARTIGMLAALAIGSGAIGSGAIEMGAALGAESQTVPESILLKIEDVVGLPSEVARGGIEFRLNAPNGVYREAEFIDFQIKAPEYDSHIYLDYYQIDGNVVHILPAPGSDDAAIPAGTELTVGAPGDGLTYEIFPPFGRELLVLMAASEPLFDQPRREFEFAPLYLEALNEGIADLRRDGDGTLAVVYRAIQTYAKDAIVAAAPKSPDRAAVQAEPQVETAPVAAAPRAQPQVVVPDPTPAPTPTPQADETPADLPSAPVVAAIPQARPQPVAPAPPAAVELPAAVSDPAPKPVPEPAVAAEPAPTLAAPTQAAALPAAPPPSDEETRLRQKIGELLRRMQQAPNDTDNLADLVATYQDYAENLADRGEYDKATRSISMAMALDPANTQLSAFSRDLDRRIAIRQSYDQGLTYLSNGETDMAYEAFQQVVTLDPGHGEARQRVAELTPEVAELYHKQALTAFRRQDLDQALEIWDKVLTIDPENQKAKLNRLLALDLKERLERLRATQ